MMKTYMFELPPIITLAFEVIAGKYGIGTERKKALEKLGYNYKTVQGCVDELVKLLNKYGDK